MNAVALIDPKFPHNVGNALRTCSAFGIDYLLWTGDRVPPEEEWPEGSRLPREERMKLYRDVTFWNVLERRLTSYARSWDATPICVEVSDNAEVLPDFVHPDRALYIFGPEDGGVPKGIRTICHRFVTIPTASCLNLAASVAVTLYDRRAKELRVPR